MLIACLITYNPARPETVPDPEPVNVEIGPDIAESDEVDSRVFEAIEKSPFAYIRRTVTGAWVNYEVYVKSPVMDLMGDTEELNNTLRQIWGESSPEFSVRVMVLNYGNMEIVDIVTENGKTVFKR